MELLPSIADWFSWNSKEQEKTNDLTVRNNTPTGIRTLEKTSETPDSYVLISSQGVIPTLLSAIDNVKGKIRRNVSDLFTDTDNALTKIADTMQQDILSKEKLQDPGQWLAGGSGKIMSAFAGAFRPSDSKLLPSFLAHMKKDVEKPDWTIQERVPLVNKLSSKELSKYGTPEFLLDKYLISTKMGGNPEILGANELEVGDFLRTADMMQVANTAKLLAKDANHIDPNVFKLAKYRMEAVLSPYNAPSLEPDIRAFRDQIKTNEPIYVADIRWASDDVRHALISLNKIVHESKYTPEQLSKKSLDQLLVIARSVEKATNKTDAAIMDFTKQRTTQLNKEQGLPPGFVELKSKADFGAETHFMDHCVGAGGTDVNTGKFLPKWHPITGEELIHGGSFQNSGEIYYGLAEKGKARYISYRPEGLPEATVEINKFGEIAQIYGEKNAPLKPELEKMIREVVKPIQEEMKNR